MQFRCRGSKFRPTNWQSLLFRCLTSFVRWQTPNRPSILQTCKSSTTLRRTLVGKIKRDDKLSRGGSINLLVIKCLSFEWRCCMCTVKINLRISVFETNIGPTKRRIRTEMCTLWVRLLWHVKTRNASTGSAIKKSFCPFSLVLLFSDWMKLIILPTLLILCFQSTKICGQDDGVMFGADEAQQNRGYCNDEYQFACGSGECIVSLSFICIYT